MTSRSLDSALPDIGRVVVDPRFRARRIAVRKQAGRRRLRRLVALIATAVAALAAVIVLESPILDVDEVAVVGTRTLDPALVGEAAGIDVGAPLLLTDLDAAARSIEALPWVAEADVSRDLPNRVTVEVTERVPSALVSIGGSTALVDASGYVLAAGDPTTYPPHVARTPPFIDVVVPEDITRTLPAAGGIVDREVHAAVALAERLRENPAGTVAAIHLEPTLSLDLTDGGRVELGDDRQLDLKVEAFRTVVARVDLHCLDTLDLRVPTHPVVTRITSC